jgi:hypothetical protein
MRLLISWLGFVCLLGVGRAEPAALLSLQELRAIRLPDVQIESAEAITPDRQKNPGAKPMVQVNGVIGEAIHFELLLPDEWNERFVMGGGGGLCWNRPEFRTRLS